MNERRAYWCLKCVANRKDREIIDREFLAPGQPIPTCKKVPAHGKLTRQENAAYCGKRK